ncbi:MAG: response regulator [Proteobacteria bacterium]|jgi:CheY-like chemotaxis protein|nr:response regulator [Pseudomonadota bacterium]MDA0927581.1 response regulator [Pseudomonadota bacterium]
MYPSHSHTILVVDDESDVVDLLVECLTDSGYRVITANDGLEALRKFEKHQPDLVISDVIMPELDGISLVKKLQASAPWAKIVLMTGYPAEVREAVGHPVNELGVVCLVAKPFRLFELLSTVHMLLMDQTMLECAV